MDARALSPSVTASRDQLDSLAVSNRHARARIYLQGAHVLSYRPVGAGEVLWSSVRSAFVPGKAIRGGVPICFPWFGPHPSRPDLPAHGFARLESFALDSCVDLPDGRTVVALALSASDRTRAWWPHDFQLRCTITVGPTLDIALAVTNAGASVLSFEAALHSYFDVAAIEATSIAGLQGGSYIDKVARGERNVQAAADLRITGETDRIYTPHAGPIAIADARQSRRIHVTKRGSHSTVVWNPWSEKAARMADFGDHEWHGMVCVETANVGADAVTVAPGATYEMGVAIAVAADDAIATAVD